MTQVRYFLPAPASFRIGFRVLYQIELPHFYPFIPFIRKSTNQNVLNWKKVLRQRKC